MSLTREPASKSGGRPYRSHKVPACDRCRKRKIRCNIDLLGQPCAFCRTRRLPCRHTDSNEAGTSNGQINGSAEPPAKRLRPDDVRTPGRIRNYHRDQQDDKRATMFPEDSEIMMGPTVAEDIEILKQHISEQRSGAGYQKPYKTLSRAPDSPVVYLTVPRRRKGFKPAAEPGRNQREILEQILGPFANEVIQLYLDLLHPCFPILGEEIYSGLRQRNQFDFSSTLLCTIYAISLPFWKRSNVLKLYPCPDITFAMNQGVLALQEEYLAPSEHTVPSILIDLIGRPSLWLTGNISNVGRAVSLSHSLGLHRDPSTWNMDIRERNDRIRLWWGVLIHDHWSSFAYGTPPNISKKYYDVPLPTQESLEAAVVSRPHRKSVATFQQLCSLTQLLGDVLSFIYTLKLDSNDMWTKIGRLETDLNDWESKALNALGIENSKRHGYFNGYGNLKFCFLSVKLLLCRLASRVAVQSTESPSSETKQCRRTMLRESASDLLDFVSSLRDDELDHFWLPYTAQLLVSATTILLRCTVEAPSVSVMEMCVSKLLLFRKNLQKYRDEQAWDLADFCLERCDDAVTGIASWVSQRSHEIDGASLHQALATSSGEDPYGADITGDLSPPHLSDIFDPLDLLGYPWENLWDPLDESSNFTF